MDTIDVAQRRQQEDIEHALQSRRPLGPGRAYCANEDCGEPISELRQKLGARRCVECEAADERVRGRLKREAF